MDTRYDIVISIRTPQGILQIGNFYVGNDIDFSLSTFNSLKGYNDADEKSILRIELVKKLQDTPLRCLATISCTLDQYVENCRIITRDVFKFFTLER